ncbi:DMT family transporter [Alkalicoccobacillus plakortidis]|uniref:Multidrug efflux SMR transporter n=1 Tax=Alkalicoccobacillus plakortidis TaxID=444060 RepID=A0ABT0XNA7_9BACI|nr:multidrug efflux SMR transporter [Alkalicoccobacillus plakortidis]MCM2676722.1 multidrug efflux SMR transporter [Alkalicoccobacillus plakortidis]
MKKEYIYLIIAIIFGLCGQVLLQYSNGFTNLFYTISCLCSYFFGFSFLALAIEKLPLSISYAIWGGLGTAMSVVFGVLLFGERLSIIKITGILLIILGIVLLQLRKKELVSHIE